MNAPKEFKDAVDPVKMIINQLPVKRQKKRIVMKIMELGLCNDVKKLMKKKVRRGMKEGDAGYLEKASESDSAMEDSSSDDEEDDRVSFFGLCIKMQLIPLQNSIIKTCFIQFLWFFRLKD